jgi:hypothetical protein
MKKYFFLISIVFCSILSAEPKAVYVQFRQFDFWNYFDWTTVVQGTAIRIDIIHDTTDTNSYLPTCYTDYRLIIFAVKEWHKGTGNDTITLRYQRNSNILINAPPGIGEEWVVYSNQSADGIYNIFNSIYNYPISNKPQHSDKALRMIKKYAQINNQIVSVKYKDHDSGKRRTANGLLINGLPEGVWYFLDKKGTPYMTGYYLHGRPDSLWIDYYRDKNDNALPTIAAKTFIRNDRAVSVSFTRESEMNYAYIYEGIQVPDGVFTKEEWTYIQEKGHK